MRISDLVRFRNILQESLGSLSLLRPINDVYTILNSTITSNNRIDESFHFPINNYAKRIQNLLFESEEIVNDIKKYISDINKQIDLMADEQFNNDHFKQEWQRVFKNGLLRDFYVTDEINLLVQARISQYIDWHYPALQFGCRYNGQEPKKQKDKFKTLGQQLNDPDVFLEFTNNLTGSEPLYVCDFNKESMQRCIAKFNTDYQKKICQYIIEDNNFNALPQNQFSFILCWNMFNYVTLEILEKYIINLMSLLRPGGVILFSYNNCDLIESMVLTEIGSASYIPKRHIEQLCNKHNFELVASFDIQNEVDLIEFTRISWVEIKKPGGLTTIKANSSLGQIIIK